MKWSQFRCGRSPGSFTNRPVAWILKLFLLLIKPAVWIDKLPNGSKAIDVAFLDVSIRSFGIASYVPVMEPEHRIKPSDRNISHMAGSQIVGTAYPGVDIVMNEFE